MNVVPFPTNSTPGPAAFSTRWGPSIRSCRKPRVAHTAGSSNARGPKSKLDERDNVIVLLASARVNNGQVGGGSLRDELALGQALAELTSAFGLMLLAAIGLTVLGIVTSENNRGVYVGATHEVSATFSNAASAATVRTGPVWGSRISGADI